MMTLLLKKMKPILLVIFGFFWLALNPLLLSIFSLALGFISAIRDSVSPISNLFFLRWSLYLTFYSSALIFSFCINWLISSSSLLTIFWYILVFFIRSTSDE